MFIQQTVTKMGSRTKHAPFQQTGGFGTDPVVGLYQHGAPFLAVVKHVKTRVESPSSGSILNLGSDLLMIFRLQPPCSLG